jgi:hypothetical protein
VADGVEFAVGFWPKPAPERHSAKNSIEPNFIEPSFIITSKRIHCGKEQPIYQKAGPVIPCGNTTGDVL